MKFNLFHLLFTIFFNILFSPKNIKGKKASITYISKHFINSFLVEPSKKELIFQKPLKGKGNFILNCEPGDKIIMNITSIDAIDIDDKYLDNNFAISITFEDETKYFFNKNNISIYDKNGEKFYFYIPYETLCENKDDIYVYKNKNKNENIIFDLKSNIFVKNNKIQSLERLSINITSIFPSNLILDIDMMNDKFIIPKSNYDNLNSPIIIKYEGISSTGGTLSLNECSIRFHFINNNIFKNNYRKLSDDIFYYRDTIYNNSKALENIEVIERFFDQGYNVFNLSDVIFNDLCIHVEENHKDVVLEDRIELYYQNYSLCSTGCIISEINLFKYEYTCKCSFNISLSNNDNNNGKTHNVNEDEFSKETISEEISDIFFETNFEVLSCFIELFTYKIYFNNYGALMTTIFLVIQFISGIFLFKQIKEIRVYLYRDVIKNSNPPLKKRNTLSKEEFQKQLDSVSSHKNLDKDSNSITPKNLFQKDIFIDVPKKNKRKQKANNESQLSSRKLLIKSSNSKIFDNSLDERINNNLLFHNIFNSGKINQPVKKIYPMFKNSSDSIKINEPKFFELDKPIQNNNRYSVYTPTTKYVNKVRRNSVAYVQKYLSEENEMKDVLNSLKSLAPNKYEENKQYLDLNQIEKNKENIEDHDKSNKINENENKSNNSNTKLSLDKNLYQINTISSEEFEEKTDRYREKDKVPEKSKEKEKEKSNETHKESEKKQAIELDKDSEKNKQKFKARKSKIRKSDIRKRTIETRNKETEKETKNTIQAITKKDFDEDDLNELDFDEAIIYDHRGFWELCWMEIKERQLIINTFFVKEKLKPFSIKLIVFIFSLTFYFVINGLLYDAKYVSKQLKRTHKTVYFFILDSIKRIIYSSIVGVIVNIIVGLLFKSDKNLRKAQAKYKDNRVMLNGEVVKIYKNMKIINIIFTIVNFIFMLMVWIYLFCFCGVYRNCQIDWLESACIIIGIMQILPFLISLLLALLRIIGLRCGVESCFKINAWISDNI